MTHIFIVNPYAGEKTFADDLRRKLKEIKNLKYFVFNTKRAGDEEALVRRILHIFQDEELRFYCCGGSGTMRNMLNGFDDLEKAEIAFFPCGLTNDFLKVFGENEARFHQIEELIEGDVIQVDYIRTNHGVALNQFSTGLDSSHAIKFEEYRSLAAFGEKIPYVLSITYALIFSKPLEYEVYLDDKKVVGPFSEIIFGNGHVMGGSLFLFENSCVVEGEASWLFVPKQNVFRLFKLLRAFFKMDYALVRTMTKSGSCKKMRLARKDGKPLAVNMDGELVSESLEWTAEIVQQGLHLVVPKGVRL